jgi:Helix-turn-helix domain
MTEASTYVPWAYTKRTGPIENTTKPLWYLPWSHLTKEEFVQAKKTYTKYWYENLSTHNFARVFGELIYHVNYETGACFPSRALIAKRLYISEKTVQRAIKALEVHGLIQVRRTRDLIRSEDGFLTKGVGRSNVYTIRFDKTMWRDENDLPIIDFDWYLDCLTLDGRRRLPAQHLWYNCEDMDESVKLPLLAPPCPAIDAVLAAVHPLGDPAVSAECPTKGIEGFQGFEGDEGYEGTNVAPRRAQARGILMSPLPLNTAPSEQPVIPAPSEQPVIPAPSEQPVIPAPSEQPVIPAPSEQPVIPAPSEQPVIPAPSDLSRNVELTVSYKDQLAIQGQKRMKQEAERQERESAAKREKEALFRAWEQEVAARPRVPEIPLVQEEEPLVD